jgi:hypothetical protein
MGWKTYIPVSQISQALISMIRSPKKIICHLRAIRRPYQPFSEAEEDDKNS